MKKISKIFSSGQVARMCGVAPRTASKWMDRGLLKGYRIPGSRDRRCSRTNLLAFMRKHDMPTDALEAAGPPVLLAMLPAARASAIAKELADCDVAYALTPFQAGQLVQEKRPAVVVVDAGAIGSAVATSMGEASESAVVVLMGDDGAGAKEWASRGWSALAADAGPGDVAVAVRKAVRR